MRFFYPSCGESGVRMAMPALLAMLAMTAPARAENFGRGQELYEDHCQACHEDLIHEKNRKIRSLDELQKRIQSWAVHTGNTWTREEINDVLYYLNKSFYRFEQGGL